MRERERKKGVEDSYISNNVKRFEGIRKVQIGPNETREVAVDTFNV